MHQKVNQSILILRTSENYDVELSNHILLEGQPLYNTQNNNIFIGDGKTELKYLSDISPLNKLQSIGSVYQKSGKWNKNTIINSNKTIGVRLGDVIPGAIATGVLSVAFGGIRHDYAGAWSVSLNGLLYQIVNSQPIQLIKISTGEETTPDSIGYSAELVEDENKIIFRNIQSGEEIVAEKYYGLIPTTAEGAQSMAVGASCYANGDWSFASGRLSSTYLRASAAFGASRAGRTPEEWIEYCAGNSYNGTLTSFDYSITDCYLALNYPNLKLPSDITVNNYNRPLICKLSGKEEHDVPMGQYLNDSFNAYIESGDKIRYMLLDSTDSSSIYILEISVKDIYKIFLDYTGRPFDQAYSFAFASGVSTASGRQSFAAVGGKATSDNTIAIGPSAESSGPNSIALGQQAKANSNVSLVIGAKSQALGTSTTVIGYNNIIDKGGATAVGNNISGLNYYCTGIGSSPIISNDTIFVVGDGNSTIGKHNALEVKRNNKNNYSLFLGDGGEVPDTNWVSVEIDKKISENSTIVRDELTQLFTENLNTAINEVEGNFNNKIPEEITKSFNSFIIKKTGLNSILGGDVGNFNVTNNFGTTCYVNGYGCVGLGVRPKIGDKLDHAYVDGKDRKVTGAVAIGVNATVFNTGGISLGYGSSAMGAYDTVIGRANKSGNPSSTNVKYTYNSIVGQLNEIPEGFSRSHIFGSYNKATSSNLTILGIAADTITNKPIFAIGDGDVSGDNVSAYRNAFEIVKNNKNEYSMRITNPYINDDNDVIVKKYADNLVAKTATLSVTYEDGTVEDLEVIIK